MTDCGGPTFYIGADGTLCSNQYKPMESETKKFSQKKHLTSREHLFGAIPAIDSSCAVSTRSNIAVIKEEPKTALSIGDLGKHHYPSQYSKEEYNKPFKKYINKSSEKPF